MVATFFTKKLTQEKADTMNKDVIVICESIYQGNTMRLAKAMAYRLNCKLVTAQDAAAIDLKQYKVIGLGSGIYFTSHHPKILDIAQELNINQKAFIFSTRGGPFLGNYHETLKQRLIEGKIEIIGEFSSKGFDCTGPFIIVGGVNKGRPNEKDAQKAIRFISSILPQYLKKLSTVPEGHFVLVDSACTQCEKCINTCPLNVFSIVEGKVVPKNQQACIHCNLCQKECRTQSISIRHGFVDAIRIAVNHAKRKGL